MSKLITGLSLSKGNTVVFTVVNHFPKFTHFISLHQCYHLAWRHIHMCSRSMASLLTSFQTETPCLSLKYGRPFVTPWVFPPVLPRVTIINQMARWRDVTRSWRLPYGVWMNKTLPLGNNNLNWIEYAFNTLTSSTPRLFSFEVSFGYSLPIFTRQETEIAVSSVPYHFWNSHRVWRHAKAVFLRTA